jgi:recombinational DNA repair protein (RecF pathway)
MSKCAICGTKLGDDLFSYVTGEKVCSICKVKFIGGLRTSQALINMAREKLGLKPDEYLKQDNQAEAAKILGR